MPSRRRYYTLCYISCIICYSQHYSQAFYYFISVLYRTKDGGGSGSGGGGRGNDMERGRAGTICTRDEVKVIGKNENI